MPHLVFDLDMLARVSPDLPRARRELEAWIPGSGLVRSEAGLRQLRSWDLALGAASVYPDATGADLGMLCRWYCLAFLFDDQFDNQPETGDPDRSARVDEVAREMIAIPLRPPGAPPGLVCPITTAWAAVWPDLARGMSDAWRDRFSANWGRFLAAHAYETSLSARGVTLDLDSYIALRRVSVGIQHSLDASERSARFEIPVQAYAQPLMSALRLAAVDVIAFMNDIHSLEREETRGDGHNLVTVLSSHHGLPRHEAIERAARMVTVRLADLRSLESRLPDLCRDLNLTDAQTRDVHRGVDAIHHWIRGNHDWGLRTGRYTNENSHTPVTRYADDLLSTSA